MMFFSMHLILRNRPFFSDRHSIGVVHAYAYMYAYAHAD